MVTRMLLAAGLALVLIGGGPALPAAAQQKPDPGELWEEFPLEPSPTPTTQPAATPTERVRVVQAQGGTDWFGIVSLMVLGAGLGAMSASLVRGRRRARERAAPAREPKPSAGALPPALSSPAAKAPEPRRRQTPRALTHNAPPPPQPGAARAKPAPPQPVPPGPPPRPRPAAPEPRTPAPAPETPAAPPRPAPLFERAPAKPEWETCRIQLWHGYVKKQFYAESPDRDAWIAWSPYFRVEKGSTIEDSEAAEEALAELVDTLVGDGWEVSGRRAGTLEVALRRRTGAARPVPRQPVD